MSGSIKTLVYDAGNGQRYYYQADESNLENLQASPGPFEGVGDFTPADSGVVINALNKSPRNGIRPRTAIMVSEDGTRSKRIIIPTQAMWEALRDGIAGVNQSFSETIQGEAVLFVLTRLLCEIINFPIAVDTGVDDGDDT